MKKGGFFRNVLDTIRSNQSNQPGNSSQSSGGCSSRLEVGGQLKSHHFALGQVARHGFPELPSALAFDPVQKIAAIGTRTGVLRVFGRPGVDVWAQHKPEHAITHIKFIVNQGAIITVTADESIHLWSLRGPNLKLQLSAHSSASSPAQTSLSPAPQSQQSTGGSSSTSPAQYGPTSGSSASDIGGQTSGDSDYLSTEQLSSSPTADPSKQYPRQPELLHTLKFQREHITYIHQTLLSKWLYIGTERGNVHVANVESFELSGYSIAWNKAIELSRKTHPGAIIHISECPQDSNKLLIGYESGCIVLWDLKNKSADGRYYQTENLLWLAWHYDGKQFVAAHGDGSLVTWQIRSNARPAQILHPHAKTAPPAAHQQQHADHQADSAHLQPASLASSYARALNNELYRPINKVDWKTSKNNEQIFLFSGGLPYDGLEQVNLDQQQQAKVASGAQRAASSVSPARLSAANSPQHQHQQPPSQPYLKTSPVSSAALTSPSPISPSISPAVDGGQRLNSSSRQSSSQLLTSCPRMDKKALRSTSLTVMHGKSITVLEMDDTVVDFVTICDTSPYENDASDPLAVIVLLTNDLILIDLTSAGYPSFDSPYPASSLNESPVTCVEYLADCSSDLIPLLYSSSQNVVSRAPKKGFSDKEWPINGGEWGQSMQSYPELVLTGHADGTIKFWDMNGVNFDLISKIKTSKLFERPQRLPNSIIVPRSGYLSSASSWKRPSTCASSQLADLAAANDLEASSAAAAATLEQLAELGKPMEDNFLAIEKIEYCASSKHLLVAGALSQLILFKLNKKEQTQSASSELTTILVEPQPLSAPNNDQHKQQQHQHHLVLKPRSSTAATCQSARKRQAGFQAEVICLTPMLVGSFEPELAAVTSANITQLCHAAPAITAMAFQSEHNV